MGNSIRKNRPRNVISESFPDSANVNRRILEQNVSNSSPNLNRKSPNSNKQRSATVRIYRPWSRVFRRRSSSTRSIPLHSSKTVWPITQIESFFLPEFPLKIGFYEKKFDVIEFVHNGAFGQVFKVKDRVSGKIFAAKQLSKSQILKETAVKQVKNEVKIQKVCGHHPFIAALSFYWQSRKRLFILTEFVEGGELFRLLKQYNVLPYDLVQIYVAEIALALDFLHNAGIIYRDLKPENLLLDNAGHIQLVDFGLAKWLSYGSRTNTICGTLRYMAPEVLNMKTYSHSADWYSLGVVACVMLTAQFPFIPKLKEHDRRQRKPCRLPNSRYLTPSTRDLLLRLLEIEPTVRLHSIRALKNISFYHEFNFEDVQAKKWNPREILLELFPKGPSKRFFVPEEDAFTNF